MKTTCGALLFTFCLSCFAQSGPNDLYSIDADLVEVDDQNQIKMYTGNARVVVANLVIEADSISIYEQGGFPSRIEATGSPIVFREQVPKKNISGTATSASFQVSELRLTLTEYSIVDPTGNNMKGKTLNLILAP